ncbi:uncharacterized protein LOC108675991 isoform X2 [Hyalella azteca]|uniref:Uncharacterized protein LOC108675991 isoform X2 n=1 Tax=Hyalella azteca TaxID=294128 RepID=A0A8B7P0B4_HYAAZ|nr:uncharacterized protein LOC108675991 isoform X2 [Hyalella azteca]
MGPHWTKVITMFYMIGALLNYAGGGIAYDPEASITGLYTGPYFDPLAPRNLTAHLGDRAVLPCTVRQMGDKSVSWVRMRDADILTVDRYTFVGDQRFEAQYSAAAETWNLIINYVQERDAGEYECQVSTGTKMSQFFNLRVVVPQVNIEPPDDRHVKAGSKVRIDCHITDVVEMPDYIFWYHDKLRVLDRIDRNLEVTLTRTGEESIMSSLHIERVEKKQSGNYTCMPSNLHGAFTLLHVLNEHPAAMQDGRNSAYPPRSFSETLVLTLFLLLLVYIQTPDGGRKCFAKRPHHERPSHSYDRPRSQDKTGRSPAKILTQKQIIPKPESTLFSHTICSSFARFISNKRNTYMESINEYHVAELDSPNTRQKCNHENKIPEFHTRIDSNGYFASVAKSSITLNFEPSESVNKSTDIRDFDDSESMQFNTELVIRYPSDSSDSFVHCVYRAPASEIYMS